MSAVLRWEDPPAPKERRRDWRQIADELRARPLAWAVVDEYSTAPAAYRAVELIRRGKRAGMARGEFEAKHVRTTDHRWRMYARYVGGAS